MGIHNLPTHHPFACQDNLLEVKRNSENEIKIRINLN
jgi:hypothetical protein